VPIPERIPRVAWSSTHCSTVAGVEPGLRSRQSAATPAACGDAIDVPLKVVEPPPLRAEVMSRPGPKRSTQVPVFEKEARASLRSLAPVPIACLTRAGDEPQASLLSFPAATA